MFDIVNLINPSANQWVNIFFLLLATLRIYLELIQFQFSELPITKGMLNKEQSVKFHRTGFYFSVGYLILFAPSTLLSTF